MKTSFFLLSGFIILTLSYFLTSCCYDCWGYKNTPTLNEKLQGKTYIITSATLAGMTKTEAFQNPDLKLVFNADGSSVAITTGGTSSTTVTTACTIGDGSIILATAPTTPGQWANSLNVESYDGATLTFTVNIQSASIGMGEYLIVTTKQ